MIEAEIAAAADNLTAVNNMMAERKRKMHGVQESMIKGISAKDENTQSEELSLEGMTTTGDSNDV